MIRTVQRAIPAPSTQLFLPQPRQRQWPSVRTVVTWTAVLAAVSLAFQLGYPSSKILPLVRVGNYIVGGQTVAGAQTALETRYKNAAIILEAGSKKVDSTLEQAGIDIDTQASAQAAQHYPWYERVLPFSSFFIMFGRDISASAHFDEARLSYFASQSSHSAYAAPVDATVTFKDGDVVLVSAKPSDVYADTSIAAAVKTANLLPHTVVKLRPTHTPAKRQDKDVEGVLAKARQAAGMSLTVNLAGDKTGVDKATIGGWLDFAEDTGGRLQLSLKAEAVKSYLNKLQAKIYKAPGTTTIQLIDGKEVSRTTGAIGQGINIDTAVTRLTSAVLAFTKTTVDLPVTQVAPAVVYKRTYSGGDAGLTALLKYIAQTKGDYAVAVMKVGGSSAQVNGGKQYTSASTYKLFVAYGVFQWINSGKMNWSDPMVNGYDAGGCFDAMIVKSDNTCAAALGDAVGWQNIDDMMTGLGLTNTQVQKGNELTTASDLALLLYKLQNGTLLNSSDQTRLTNDMKQQIYRQGIPAGTGVTVADKVGFLDALIHDAGIVYAPKGTYILVIMTNNSSWGQVADAAQQINNYLNQ